MCPLLGDLLSVPKANLVYPLVLRLNCLIVPCHPNDTSAIAEGRHHLVFELAPTQCNSHADTKDDIITCGDLCMGTSHLLVENAVLLRQVNLSVGIVMRLPLIVVRVAVVAAHPNHTKSNC